MPDEVIVKTEGELEVPAEVLAAVAEAQSEQAAASVEIAAIQEEGETARAEIAAETNETVVEAQAEIATAVSREELEECRRNSETALRLAEETRSMTQSILERLEPPSLPSPSESPANVEAVPPEVAESPPEPEKKKSKVRWT